MYIQTDFDIGKCLKNLGFEDVDKSMELLYVKDNITIYSCTDCIIPPNGGYPLGMVIKINNEIVYKGIIPQSEKFLIDLLDSLFPKDELLEEINSSMFTKFIDNNKQK